MPTTSVDRKHFGTSTIRPHLALPVPAAAWMLYLSTLVLVAGCREQAKPVVRHRATEVNPAEAGIVAEIERIGGEVTIDADGSDRSVTEVRLTCCELTDGWLKRLEGLTSLRSLSLNGTNVSDDGLEHVKRISSLEDLSLYGTLVTDAGLAHLKELPSLRSLNLTSSDQGSGPPGAPKAYSSNGLSRPDAPPRPHGIIVTDVGLKHLQGLTGLQSLQLQNTQITDAGLRSLAELTNLGTLDLRNTAVTDAGLEHLKGLSKLQDLLLTNTKVTDRGLEYLEAMTSLQCLDLGGFLGPVGDVEVTDAGLEHLKGLPNLFHLKLWGTKVTADGVERFRQASPTCGVQSPYGNFPSRVRQHRERVPGSCYWRLIPEPVEER
jgi:internalin A